MTSDRLAMIDGELVLPERALVSAWDRGFLYGDGVFETMRTYGAEVFAVEEHVARLARSARAISLPLPVAESILVREVRLARASSSLEEAALRLVLTRGAGIPGAVSREPIRATRVVLVDPLPPADETSANGAITVTRPWTPPIVPGAKLSSYLPHLLAANAARAAGAHEALLVDSLGRIREGATSNVFVVDAGVLVTAPAEDEILEGITRSRVLLAAARLGIRARLESPTLGLANAADEVFLTSTFREVMSVSSIDGGRLRRSGEVADVLRRAFR